MKQPYDKVKAHEYYMKHRKLKGKRRKAKAKVTGGKIANRKNKVKAKAVIPKNISLQTKNSGGKGTKVTLTEYERLGAKLADIKERAVKLPPEKKKAVKVALMSIRGKIKKG